MRYFQPGIPYDYDLPRDNWKPGQRLEVLSPLPPRQRRPRFRTGRIDCVYLRPGNWQVKRPFHSILHPDNFREVPL